MNRKLSNLFDLSLLSAVGLLLLIGLLNIWSASIAGGGPNYALRQLIWLVLAILTALPFFLLDYRDLERMAMPALGFVVVLLIAVLVAGKLAGGAQRWLPLGPLNLQPSEFSKLLLVIVLAGWFHRHPSASGYRIRDILPPLAITGVCFGLIIKQPDLGTAGLHLLIAGVIFVTAGLHLRSLIVTGILSAPALVASWFWVLKPYQKRRILTVIDPERDPLGSGYHIIQSKIAIGSGRWAGVHNDWWPIPFDWSSFAEGTQNKFNFLPEQHTDFIFSVLGEEWGFVGSMMVIALIVFVLQRMVAIARDAQDTLGALITVGCAAVIFWQAAMNIAMVLGVFPVVGMTLPFMSYGGSSLLTVVWCLALVTNVHMRSKIFG